MINITLWVLRIMDPHTPWKNQWPQLNSGLTRPCRLLQVGVQVSGRALGGEVFQQKFDGSWWIFDKIWWFFGWYFIDFFWILDGTSLMFLTNFWVALSPKQNTENTLQRRSAMRKSNHQCGLCHLSVKSQIPCEWNGAKIFVGFGDYGSFLHPWKLSWNLKITCLKRNIIWTIQLHF